MKIAIIGAGASGLLAGGFLSQEHDVTIFDKNEKCGKKLYITGKGRCNLTNDCDEERFLANVVNGKKFMMSSIHAFPPKQIREFFEELGLPTKVERGGRVFPKSDKSSDVIKVLQKFCQRCKIKLGEDVTDIDFENDQNCFKIITAQRIYYFDRVIIATGGKSYSATGSTGDGYKFAKKFGHTIVDVKPALVPIEVKDKFIKDLQGITLKNVTLKATIDGKKLEFFGELLFTDRGLTGPIALSMSSYINRAEKVELSIDFKPALDENKLKERCLRDIEANKNKSMSTFAGLFFPKAVGKVVLERLKIDGQKKVNSFTSKERQDFIEIAKNFKLNYGGLYPIESAIITSGGVDTKQVNPKTMESKLQPGLHLIGEVLDVDCLTGGYNLTTAFATAYACAKNMK